jgi:hypothetical protein
VYCKQKVLINRSFRGPHKLKLGPRYIIFVGYKNTHPFVGLGSACGTDDSCRAVYHGLGGQRLGIYGSPSQVKHSQNGVF